MRFPQSTGLLMPLSSEILSPIIRIGLPILVEVINLVNSVIIFFISNDLTQMVNVPTWTPDYDSHSPALLDLLLSCVDSICSTIAFPPLGNSDYAFVSVSIDFPPKLQWEAPFHGVPYDYYRAYWGMVLLIIGKMFQGRISLHLVLLVLLLHFVSGFRLELIYISLKKISDQVSFISMVCRYRINLLILK